MKLLMTIIGLALTYPTAFAANALMPSACAKTLLTQAFECISAKQTTQGIALYIQVRDHPHSKLTMVLQVSRELKSHQLKEDAVLGYKRAMNCQNISENQLLNIGRSLLELAAFNEAKSAFEKVLNHTKKPSDATRNYIAELCASIPKED